jgi:chromate reductase
MRVLGISGSLRRDSHNTKLLRAVAELLPPGCELVIWGELRSVPPFDEDEEHTPPPAVESLKRAVADADALLIVTPEYNHSLPGQLKNALDWLSRPIDENPLRGKPAAVIGASTGMFGAVWSQAEGRKVLGALGARVLDHELPVPHAHERFDEKGRLGDDELRDELAVVVEALAEARTGVAAAA